MHRLKSISKKALIPVLLCLPLLLSGLSSPVFAAEEYLSTGLGKSKREMHPEYPVKFEFSLRTGPYVAEVAVDIYQDGKKIKSIHSPGPWLYVDLEPGSYSVVASLADGRKQGARFTAPESGQQQIILSWPKE